MAAESYISSDENDSIWGTDEGVSNQEWSKMDEDYTNAGYREGITAGKEAALQEGFDDGFASVGAPLGRELGMLRGVANALKAFLASKSMEGLEGVQQEIGEITKRLSTIHFTDLAPPDLEAEAHAREHLEDNTQERQMIDGVPLEKILNSAEEVHERPAVEELRTIRGRLEDMLQRAGLDLTLA